MRDQRWSEGLVKQAVWLSGLVPYEQAAQILEEVGQVTISASSVWRLTQKWGEQLQSWEDDEQERANATPDGKEILSGEVH